MRWSADVDQFVEAIVLRVKEQLQAQAAAQVDPSSPCRAGKHECIGCGWSVRRRPADVRRILDHGAARVASRPGVGPVQRELASHIDHTLLRANATRDELRALCEEAVRYGFATVCVNPSNVRFCANLLRGTPVGVCTVVGFPLGATTSRAKAFEAREAIRHGATEIDMVMNIGALKSKDYATVLDDIAQVVAASAPHKVKVILETGMLSDRDKVIACALAKAAGAHFVKTSTGFGPGGATIEDVRLMKEVVGDDVEVKASGGVRTAEAARQMLAAGATRIGASASVAIVTGRKPRRRAA